MSIEAMNLVRGRLVANPRAKFVLFVMASYVDQRNRCYVTQKNLAAYTSQTERSVRDQMAWLIQEGLIKPIDRIQPTESVGRPATEYIIDLAAIGELPEAGAGINNRKSLQQLPEADAGITGSSRAPYKDRKEGGKEDEEDIPPLPPIVTLASSGMEVLSPDPIYTMVEVYHAACPPESFPRVRTITPGRRRGLAARLKDLKGNLDEWREICERAAASDWLSGRAGRSAGHENWQCDLDFIIRPEKFHRLREGRYDNRNGRRVTAADVQRGHDLLAREIAANPPANRPRPGGGRP